MNRPLESDSAGRPQGDRPLVSLIIPVYNEVDCIGAVVGEAVGVLESMARPYEVLVVDDGSSDGTAEVLLELRSRHPGLRILRLAQNSGQSAAFDAGFRAIHGAIAVLMDGDGQNDPRSIPELMAALDNADVCCGIRRVRCDTWAKRVGSRWANRLRQRVLKDGILDTGCSLKAIRSEFLADLPMSLRGMHRFLPALLLMRGARVVQLPVNHRPRAAGHSKYTNLGRLMETVADLRAVRWMQKRYRRYRVVEWRAVL